MHTKLEGNQKLLRIFVGEQDKWHGLPLHEAIDRFTICELKLERLPENPAHKKEYDFYDRIESENQYYIVQRKVTHISARQVRIPQPLGKYKILVERL